MNRAWGWETRWLTLLATWRTSGTPSGAEQNDAWGMSSGRRVVIADIDWGTHLTKTLYPG